MNPSVQVESLRSFPEAVGEPEMGRWVEDESIREFQIGQHYHGKMTDVFFCGIDRKIGEQRFPSMSKYGL